MSTTAARFLSGALGGDRLRAASIFSLALFSSGAASLLLMLSVWLAADSIARVWLSDATLAASLRVCTPAIGATAFAATLSGVLQGIKRFDTIARVEILGAIVSLLAIVAGAVLYGPAGAVAGFTLGALVRLAAFCACVRPAARANGWWPMIRPTSFGVRTALRFSLPALAAALLVEPALWGVRALLAHRPMGYIELGLFTAALQWQMPLAFGGAVLSSVLLPHLADLHGRGDAARFESAARRSFFVLACMQIILAFLIIVFSRIIVALYGTDFERAQPVLAVVVIGAFLNSILSALASVIAASDRMWVGFSLNLLWACLLLAFAISLVPQAGALGAAIAYAAAYAIHTLTSVAVLSVIIRTGIWAEARPILLLAALVLGPAVGWATGYSPPGLLAVSGVLLLLVCFLAAQRLRTLSLGDSMQSEMPHLHRTRAD